nr:Gag-Pol polyprotein [Tanacetum cinerariifolium]
MKSTIVVEVDHQNETLGVFVLSTRLKEQNQKPQRVLKTWHASKTHLLKFPSLQGKHWPWCARKHVPWSSRHACSLECKAMEKKAKLFNEWERFTSNEGESIQSYYHRFLKLMNDLKRNSHFPEKIASNLKFLNNLGVGHFARNYTVRPRRKDVAYLQTQLLIAQKEEAGIQLQAEEFDLMAAVSLTVLIEVQEWWNRFSYWRWWSRSSARMVEPI